jgi:hypothetical protein
VLVLFEDRDDADDVADAAVAVGDTVLPDWPP